jgi:hypothetical protein
MRRISAAVGVLIIVAGVGSAQAQQSLSEVAGSIKLKKPEGEQVVIDRATLGQSGSSASALMAASDALLETTVECAAAATALVDLLEETGGSMAFYDDGWRVRVSDAGDALFQAYNNVRIVVGQGRYEAANDMAERGSDLAMAGLEILRGAIASDRPVFSEAKRQLSEGIGLLESAQDAVRGVKQVEQVEADPPLINPIAADQSIRALCGRRFERETTGFNGCVEEQKAAVDALVSRYAPGVGLDNTTFNVVRNKCQFEWPGDFVNRDRCERQRIATISK